MIVVLGFDGLGLEWVERYNLKALMQRAYTETDLSGYRGEQTYTPVIWGSMLTGRVDREMEEVFLKRYRFDYRGLPFLKHGKKYVKFGHPPFARLVRKVFPLGLRRRLGKIYERLLGLDSPLSTWDWLKRRNIPSIFDEINRYWHNRIPGFNGSFHLLEERRRLLLQVLEGGQNKYDDRLKYDRWIWKEYSEKIQELAKLLDSQRPDMVFFYTKILDNLGHLHFGEPDYRFALHQELNRLARDISRRLEKGDCLYIVSDHGMKPLGRFGDHTRSGFFSSNTGELIQKPTELYHLLRRRLSLDRRREKIGLSRGI